MVNRDIPTGFWLRNIWNTLNCINQYNNLKTLVPIYLFTQFITANFHIVILKSIATYICTENLSLLVFNSKNEYIIRFTIRFVTSFCLFTVFSHIPKINNFLYNKLLFGHPAWILSMPVDFNILSVLTIQLFWNASKE